MNFKDIPQFSKAKRTHQCPWDGIKYQLNWYRKSFTLDLDPEFQRGHVWTEGQQTAFVEFKLRGGQGGENIYLNAPFFEDYKGLMTLVDGKQRLAAILNFLDNKLKVFGLLFDEFDGKIHSSHTIKFNINTLDNRGVLEWYLSLNSGVAHTDEELNRVRAMLK